jgi:5-methylcytosine-specific restriction endonuclease McrA
MLIGEFVRRHIPAIFRYCETVDPAEIARLQDAQYSKETLGIHYPFCKPVAMIGADKQVRYWRGEYPVAGMTVRVTSQWFNPPTSDSRALFRRYLAKRGITFEQGLEDVPPPVKAAPRQARGRYKGNAIGNAQNAFVRNLLSRLGDEQFNAAQWQAVIEDFGARCAYCGSDGALVMDHVVAINRTALGEHRLGNLVPACRSCNARKADQGFRAFIADDPARIAAIEAHMTSYDYAPIGQNQRLGQIIDLAHRDLRDLAERYVAIIDTLLATDTAERPD